MEVLQADMAQLMSSKKSSNSILDIVGADVNSSYDRAQQVQFVSDTFHISAGGQNIVGGNYNIQIQLRDDNAIHYLKRSGILFDYIGDAATFPHNAAALFTGLEISFGAVTLSTPFQHFYVQQKISKMGKKKLEKYANGLAMKLSDFGYLPAWRVNAGALESFVPVLTHGGQAPPQYVGEAQALSQHYNAIHRILGEHFSTKLETNAAGEFRVKMFVPFNLIFPCLDELPDDGALFTGYGQAIKMNIRTNMPGDCLNSVQAGAAAPTYTLQNMQLVKIFSKLDQPRADLVLKSSITLPLCKYVHWQQAVTTPTFNAIYSVSKDDLVTGLIFGFHTRTACAQTAEATNIVDNLINGAACQFKSPLSYFPQLNIQQMEIHMGGEPIILNNQQIQGLHVMDTLSDDLMTYHHPILRSMKYAFRIDLRRFSEDLFGSSSKQPTTVQVLIQLKTEGGSRTMYLQPADWTAVTYQNFSFYSYLETLNFMELKQGIYQSK